MPSNAVQLHRVIRTTPEKLYKAFLDPDALAKWLPPNGRLWFQAQHRGSSSHHSNIEHRQRFRQISEACTLPAHQVM